MKASSGSEWFEDALDGFTAYFLTSLPVLLGVLFGADFLYGRDRQVVPRLDPVSASIHFDAYHYLDIIRTGYSYNPTRQSRVAFFPAYPFLARWLSQATGLLPEEAALLVAHVALLAAFVLLARYVRLRWPEATAGQRGMVLVVFGLWPLGLFFRMPYSESLFLCSMLALLYGMARRWPLAVLAVLAGFGTAVRPVGVALTAAFAWYVLTRTGQSWGKKAAWVLLLTPLACWGLLSYMGYQWLAFGTPWAFAQTQEHWSMLAPPDRSWPAKLGSLAILEPIWGAYLPDYPRYWANAEEQTSPLFSLIFWNPVLFVLAWALLGLGGWKRWLTGSELVLGMTLLAIPYLTRSYEMSMAAHGRFAAVVVVNYLVIGRLLARVSPLVMAAVYAVFALGICLLTALYATNHLIF